MTQRYPENGKSRWNEWRAMVAVVFLLLTAVCAAGASEEKKPAPTASPPPPEVVVVEVAQRDIPVYSEWVGTTDGVVNATIRAQVQGYLIKQNYQDGEFVKKGQILFEIDPRPFKTVVDQAKGQLAQKEARWRTAKATLDRIRPLAAQNAISQKDLDDAIGMEQSTQADVISAKASVEKAQLELGFTKIMSPIDGISGMAKAQIGDLVGTPGSPELTSVSTVDPIRVYVAVSEQEYLQRAQEGPREKVPRAEIELILADGARYPHKGTFGFADRQVDVKTGTIRVATLFPNPGNVLRPGQFGKIRAVTKSSGALLVPQRTVTELQGRHQVAVVGPDNKVAIRPVKVGDRVDSLWIVLEGLKVGERVVAEGVQKVREGMVVNPKLLSPATK